MRLLGCALHALVDVDGIMPCVPPHDYKFERSVEETSGQGGK